MASQLQISPYVHFIGYKPHTEMADIYAAADIFLFPSQTETQGLVTIEALASGTPVVAVRGPGTLDILVRFRPEQLPHQQVFVQVVSNDKAAPLEVFKRGCFAVLFYKYAGAVYSQLADRERKKRPVIVIEHYS